MTKIIWFGFNPKGIRNKKQLIAFMTKQMTLATGNCYYRETNEETD